MLSYFYLGMMAAALLGVLAMLGRQLVILRRHPERAALDPVSLGELGQRQLDRFYCGFAAFFAHARHYIYLYSLLAIRRALVLFRFILTRVEQYFSRLIESVHGKRLLEHAGPGSLFLTQIKNHKDAALAAKFKTGE